MSDPYRDAMDEDLRSLHERICGKTFTVAELLALDPDRDPEYIRVGWVNGKLQRVNIQGDDCDCP